MHVAHKKSGYLLVLVLVFGAIFSLMAVSFVGYVVTQVRVTESKYNKEQALQIAEAGLDYYKWFLAHYPGNITNGTTTPGPYAHTYSDPEGSAIGEFSLVVASSTACGDVYAVDITSTGATYENPTIERTVYGRYARPTVAEYAFIINANVWAGSDRTIIGPYHSNGGVRMDGTNNSTVTSGQETWSCTSSFGCSPTTVENGVFGGGPNNVLWNFPAPPINFTGLTLDLAAMQSKAQTGGGLYIGPSGAYGYRIHFNADGTMDVYKVDATYNYWGYTSEDSWKLERHVINNETFLANYVIPTSCSIIYVEDKVWLEGTVKGKVTIAVADVDTVGVDPSIILNNNITYADATSGLLAVGEEDVLVGLVVPDDMILNGIFIAQNGRYGRNHYNATYLPAFHDPYVERNSLTINGSIISNGRVGTNWGYSDGSFASGYHIRFSSYDRALVADPPPLTPEVSDTYKFIEWREVN